MSKFLHNENSIQIWNIDKSLDSKNFSNVTLINDDIVCLIKCWKVIISHFNLEENSIYKWFTLGNDTKLSKTQEYKAVKDIRGELNGKGLWKKKDGILSYVKPVSSQINNIDIDELTSFFYTAIIINQNNKYSLEALFDNLSQANKGLTVEIIAEILKEMPELIICLFYENGCTHRAIEFFGVSSIISEIRNIIICMGAEEVRCR